MLTCNYRSRVQNQLIFVIFIALAGEKSIHAFDNCSINFVGILDNKSLVEINTKFKEEI